MLLRQRRRAAEGGGVAGHGAVTEVVNPHEDAVLAAFDIAGSVQREGVEAAGEDTPATVE